MSAIAQQQSAATGTQYWADLRGEQLGDFVGAVTRKHELYFRALDEMGMRVVWRVAYSHFYGMSPDRFGRLDSQEVRLGGEFGENIVFRVNDFRSFVKQLITMAIGQRPAYQCLAVNDDFDSLAQIEGCNNAINYVANRAYGEDLERLKCELQKLCGWSWDWHRWDEDGGEEVSAPDAAVGGLEMAKVRSGAPTVTPKGAHEVAHDTECLDGRHVWVTVADRVSKWLLAATYPSSLIDGSDQAEKILALDGAQNHGFDLLRGTSSSFFRQGDTDAVTVRHFYHARTRALPQGRYAVIAGDIVLEDGPLPSEEIPAVCFMPARIAGTSFGYSDAWDLIPAQQMIDQIRADWATSAVAFGKPTLLQTEGTTLTVSQLAKGMRICTKKPGTDDPKIMPYPAMPETTPKLVEHLESRMKENSALNSTTRGDPDGNIKSGQYAALMHSIALETNSADQQAVDASREANGNRMLEMIKHNAKYPFLVEVAGEDEMAYAQSFETDRLRKVKRVRVVTANPMQRTQAGRMEMFDRLMQIPGAISTPEQGREVLVSGQLKPAYQAGRARMLRIKFENEQLTKGSSQITALKGQNPYIEVPEHEAALDRLLSQPNPDTAAIQRHLAHIAEHWQVYMQTDPITCALNGYPPPPQAMGMPGGPAPQPANDNGAPSEGAKARGAAPKDMGVPLPKPAQSPMAPQQQGAA